MYLLDTNVISELRKSRSGRIDANVAAWSRSVRENELYLSAITIFELRLGALLLERRDARQGVLVRTWLNDAILPAFDQRILPVTSEIAIICAELNMPDKRPLNDAIIAATGLAHGLVVVTRNLADFKGTGVSLLDPWQA